MKRISKTTKTLTIAALSALAVLATMPMTATAQTETEERPVIKVPRAGGRLAFEKFLCTTCHMPDGRGGHNEGGYGADLRVTPLNEAQIIFTIVEGRTTRGMPAFKGQIDQETLEQLARYIKEDLRLKK